MPRHEESNRIHKAVLWEFRYNSRTGEPVVDSPVEINVRWVWTRRQLTNSQGQPVTLDAMAVIQHDGSSGEVGIPENSIMWKGTLANIPGTTLTPESGLMSVVSNDWAEDIKGRVYSMEIGMRRFNGRMPLVSPSE